MTVYRHPNQLYTCVNRAFELIEDHHFFPIHKGKMVIYFLCENPTAELVIDGRNLPVTTHFGVSPPSPTLTISLEADTLHQIMLGDLGILQAMGQNKIKAKGSLLKARALGDLFAESKKVYPQILRAEGLV